MSGYPFGHEVADFLEIDQLSRPYRRMLWFLRKCCSPVEKINIKTGKGREEKKLALMTGHFRFFYHSGSFPHLHCFRPCYQRRSRRSGCRSCRACNRDTGDCRCSPACCSCRADEVRNGLWSCDSGVVLHRLPFIPAHGHSHEPFRSCAALDHLNLCGGPWRREDTGPSPNTYLFWGVLLTGFTVRKELCIAALAAAIPLHFQLSHHLACMYSDTPSPVSYKCWQHLLTGMCHMCMRRAAI